MITISIAPSAVNLRTSRLSPLLVLVFLLSHTILLLIPRNTWFEKSQHKAESIFGDGIIACHSFTLQRQWPATPISTPSKRTATRPDTRGRFSTILSKSKDGDDNKFSDAPVEEIQQRLVEKGIAFKQSSLEEKTHMTRVPGCVATVYVVAKEQKGVGNEDGASTIHLYGNADAVFSRGLLSVLKDYLQQLNLDEVLQLDPMEVADVLGVRPALSKGRNDGLANMLNIIQKQLKDEDSIEAKESSTAKLTNATTQSSSSLSLEKKPTVALLLSGGVDSSVAFRLLLEEGYDVTPFYLKIWLEDELAHLGECPWEDDVNTCRQVCDQVGIDLEIIGLQEEYHQRVMQHTLNEASLGRTPNPDILCNSRVKFGCFLEYLKGLPNQFDYIASGHYAQVKRDDNDANGDNNSEDSSVARLYRAPDPVKDQSYFLCALDQSQLSRLLFPIGHLEKPEVRELAEKFQLPNRHRPDSQGLCFLGKVKFRDFMQIHLGEKVGDLIDAVTGETIGQHHGVWYHTVGQRKGIGPYLHPKATAKGPWYVVAKVRVRTRLAVG